MQLTVAARRRIVCAAALTALAPALRAGQYPSRPLRLVVPFPAGGPTDIVARPLAQLLGAALGQPVFVDNRGGADGSMGADAVAKAPPDGYTLLLGTVGTSAINAALYQRLPHDPVRDFTPIASIASAPVAIAVYAQAGFASLAELVAKARARPDCIPFGSAGGATPGHIAGAMFCTAAGIRMLHIPYKGERVGFALTLSPTQARGWKRLATNSAKLVNILGGYGYSPMLASMRACVDAAETGALR